MKIKKKELRKREAQLPINYPSPEVEDMQHINKDTFNAQKTRVELLCKRLAHNEVIIRDAVLTELPRYIQSVTHRLLELEGNIDVMTLRRFIHIRNNNMNNNNNKSKNKNKKGINNREKDQLVINVLRELETHRSLEENTRRKQRRQEAIRRLKEQQQQREEAVAVDSDIPNNGNSNNNGHMNKDGTKRRDIQLGVSSTTETTKTTRTKNVRQIYLEWISAWSEVELLFLKLSRGLFFCLWHSDKPLVQLECAQQIARLLHVPYTHSGKILLFSCLMRVLVREWRTMDRYRSDKFLAFVRKLIYELANILKSIEEETRLQQRNKTTVIHSTTTEEAKRENNNNEDNNYVKDMNNSTLTQTSSLLKRTLTTGKRKRSDIDNSNNDNSGNEDNIVVDDDDVLTYDPLCRLLDEACYVFQVQIIPDPIGVGLTMHICDVLFDELCRAALSPTLFIALSDRVALYAMSQGNYVEKRVLDYFISPIASGILNSRRRVQEELCSSSTTSVTLMKRKKYDNDNNNDNEENNNNDNNSAVDNAVAHMKADAETNVIIVTLAECCKRYAVARGTVRQVRVMFTESELALRQAADPDMYKELTRGALRRRMEREIEDIEETRHAVVEERRNLRLLRQREEKQQLRRQKKRRTHIDNNNNEEGEEEEAGTRQKGLKKKKPQPRNTKRKKHYTLTKEDLYADE